MGPYKISCVFDDGKKLEFDCEAEDDLVTGAEKQGLSLVFGCRQGVCGTCKVRCLSGEVCLGKEASLDALPETEREQGFILSCVTSPRSDLTLEFPYDAVDVGVGTEAKSGLAKVVECKPLSATVYSYSLQQMNSETGKPEAVEFVPGQYMEINIPGTDYWRAFSMASVSSDKGGLEFMIRLQEQGRFADYLRDSVKIGQHIKVNGPYGQFTLHPSDRVRAFIAGSTGLAPLVSMIRGMATNQDDGEAHLFFGMNDYEALFYQDELQQLDKALPNLKLHLFLMNPSKSWQGETGSPVDGFREQFSGSEILPDVYICGPDGMIKATEKICDELNISTEQQFKEIFVPSGRA